MRGSGGPQPSLPGPALSPLRFRSFGDWGHGDYRPGLGGEGVMLR